MIEVAERRDRLIEAETRRLKAGSGGPVIAAGSTGSMPSTAMLLETIASLPQGAIVLPGLDTDLDETSWRMILAEGEEAVGHPQYGLAALLQPHRHHAQGRDGACAAGSSRARSVRVGSAAACGLDRSVAKAADAKTDFPARRDEHRSRHMAVIEAAHSEEEAVAIAIALREASMTARRKAASAEPR